MACTGGDDRQRLPADTTAVARYLELQVAAQAEHQLGMVMLMADDVMVVVAN
ncbi:hypothetical protein Pstr01_40860 [Pseudomonas straminea]|nr:hypothetical protein Pstr01_40860 [Pseudomonas straminea]